MTAEKYKLPFLGDFRTTTKQAGPDITADLEATFFDGATKNDKLRLIDKLKNAIVSNITTHPAADTGAKYVALIGDSLADQNSDPAGSGEVFYQNGYFISANAKMGNRFVFGDSYNKAVGGRDIDDVDTNKVTDLGSLSPLDIVSLQAGTNDVVAATTIESMKTSLDSVVTYVTVTLGKILVINTVPPRDSATSDQKDKLDAYNAYIRTLASDSVIIVDYFDEISDGNRNFATGMSEDGVHPNGKGAEVAGQKWKEVMEPFYGVYTQANLTGTEIFSNPTLSGTSGTKASTVTGTVADGIHATGSGTGGGVTRVSSKPTENSMAIDLGAEDGGSGFDSMLYELIANVTTGYSVGDVVYGWVEIKLLRGVRIDGPWIVLNDIGSSTVSYTGFNKPSAGDFSAIDEYAARGDKLILTTPRCTVQATNTALDFFIRNDYDNASFMSYIDYELTGFGIRNEG